MRLDFKITLNWFLFLSVILFFVVIQTTIFNMFLSSYFSPDLVSVIVIYMGMKRNLIEGAFFVSLTGYLFYLHSGSGFLSATLLYLLVFFISHYISLNFYISNTKDLLLSIAVCVFLYKLLLSIWLYWSDFTVVLQFILYGFISAWLTAGIGVLLFKILSWLDIITGRSSLESYENKV